MKASYKDECMGCGEVVEIGDEIHWVKVYGSRCEDCGPHDPSEPPRGASTDEDVPGYVLQLRKRLDNLQAQVDQLGIAVTTIKQSAEIHNKILTAMAEWIEKLSTDLDIEPPDFPE